MVVKSIAEGATAELCSYILKATASDIPDDVFTEGTRAFVNIFGCTIGGARHDAVERTWAALSPFAGAEHATLIGRMAKSDALTATLLNTLASSVNTYDDTHATAVIHPSGPVMAALLAIAEQHPISGEELLAAFILGVEANCRLSVAASVAPAEYKIAWSQTGIACGIGTALASARLLGLDEQAARRAVGIAASQSAGIRVMHGTMCTPMMPAHASQVGLRAALLAQAGVTSSEVSLEGRYGFLECFAEKPVLDALTSGLGNQFEVLANTYKPYPCGIVIHPLIDATLAARREHALDPEAVDTMSFHAHPGAMALCFRRHPRDDFEGQVSLFQWVAAAMVRGRAGVAEGTNEAIADPAISEFRERITVTSDAAMPIDGTDLLVRLKDGSSREIKLRDCIGSVGRPMTNDELNAKFRNSGRDVLEGAQLESALSNCWSLRSMPDAAELVKQAA